MSSNKPLMDELEPGDRIYLDGAVRTVRSTLIAKGRVHITFDTGPICSYALNPGVEADVVGLTPDGYHK